MAKYGVFGVIQSVVGASLPVVKVPFLPRFFMTIPAAIKAVSPVVAQANPDPLAVVDPRFANQQVGLIQQQDQLENGLIGAVTAKNPVTGLPPVAGDATEPV